MIIRWSVHAVRQGEAGRRKTAGGARNNRSVRQTPLFDALPARADERTAVLAAGNRIKENPEADCVAGEYFAPQRLPPASGCLRHLINDA